MAAVFNLDKLKELIVLLARHHSVDNLGATKVAKLVYYIDAEAMRHLGDSVTSSEFIKHEHGPVPSRLDRALKQLRRAEAIRIDEQPFFDFELKKVEALREADRTRFTTEELAIVDQVVGRLGHLTAAELSQMSHREPAWREAEYLQKLDAELIPYGTEEDPTDL